MALIVKNNIRRVVKELDKENKISSVAEEVAPALEKKVENILDNAIKRANANNRKNIQARDL